jgi:aconitase A
MENIMGAIDIKSKINMKEELENKERKFGSTLNYYPAYVVMSEGEEVPALFTADQLKEAMDRAAKNPEDIEEEETSFWSWLTGN